MKTERDAIEMVARAWASIDGKLEQFTNCKADDALDAIDGYYMGYVADAEELIERAGVRVTNPNVIRPTMLEVIVYTWAVGTIPGFFALALSIIFWG